MAEQYVYVKVKKLDDLARGDIVRNKTTRNTFVVTGNYGSYVTAVQSVDVSNPQEWEILRLTRGKLDDGTPVLVDKPPRGV